MTLKITKHKIQISMGGGGRSPTPFFNVFIRKKARDFKESLFPKIIVKKCFFFTLSVETWEWGGEISAKKPFW